MRSLLVFVLIAVITACNDDNNPPPKNSFTEIVQSYMHEHEYVGLAIAAIKGDELVFKREFGYLDLAKRAPFSVNEVISLGSNAKTVTASAILKLQEKGLLNISDSLAKHLPYDLKGSENVSLYEMLCHSSDLPDVFGVGEFENYEWQKAKSQKELVDKLNSTSELPNAGNSYSYNNTAYFLLGLVVEHLSNQSLGDFYRENIFKQASDNIYYLGDAHYMPQLSPSFEKIGFSVSPYESPVEYRIVGGAGALGGDLISYLHLFKNLVDGNVLSKQSQAQMLTPCVFNDGAYVVNEKKQHIGLGVEISTINSEKVYSRGGALNGYVSAVYYFPSRNLTVGITGNTWAPLAPLLESLFKTNWLNEL